MKFHAADIYWFSGTGNTLLVARTIADTLAKLEVDVRLRQIAGSETRDIDSDRALGIAVPVAMQGTFPFIWRFIKNLPATMGTPAFFVDTLLGYSGGILYPTKRILRAKGYSPIGAKEILMPSNVFLRQGMTEKKREKIGRGLRKARRFAERLVEGKTVWIDIPGYSNLLSSISRSEGFWRLSRNITPPRIDTSRCNGCGLCVKLCPVGNIDSAPCHKEHCEYCMRCFAFCPQEAVYFEHYKSAVYRAVEAFELA